MTVLVVKTVVYTVVGAGHVEGETVTMTVAELAKLLAVADLDKAGDLPYGTPEE